MPGVSIPFWLLAVYRGRYLADMDALYRLLMAALFIPLWAANAVVGSASETVNAPPVCRPPFRVEVDGRPLDTAAVGGHCGPCIFDVNGDGRHDLVVGDFSGTFRVLGDQHLQHATEVRRYLPGAVRAMSSGKS
jgi:hypothetical protein